MKIIAKYLSQAHFLFVLLALIFGVTFVKIIPPLWGVDESSHFARVYQLAHGDIVTSKTASNYGGRIPSNLLKLDNYVEGDLADNKGGGIATRKDIDSSFAYSRLASPHFSTQTSNYLWTATYSPVAYLGPVTGVLLADSYNASIGQTILLARIGSLFLYIAIVWSAIWLLRASKLKWLIFITALLPASLFQASVVTADNAITGLSLLFVALLFRLTKENGTSQKNRLFYALFLVAILLPLIKTSYLFLSLGILLVPNKMFRTGRRAATIKGSSVFITTALSLIWMVISKATSQGPVSQRPDGVRVAPTDQFVYMVHHPLNFLEAGIRSIVINIDSYLQSLVSMMGWNWVSVPYVFIFLLCMGLILAALYAKPELYKMQKQLLMVNLFILVGIVSIFAGLYIAFNPTGSRIVDGIQGRYFIPFLAPILMYTATVLPIDIKIKHKLAPFAFVFISTTGLLLSLAYYYFALYGIAAAKNLI